VKPVTDPRIIESAWRTFTRVFDNTWTVRHPRGLPKAALPNGERLLYPQGYQLSEEAFAALRAAAAIYEEAFYCLIMTEYDADKPQFWTLEWSEGPKVEPPGNLNLLENAIFSPTGRWGVWHTQTDIAVMAGEERFFQVVESALAQPYADQLALLIEEAVDSQGRPDDYLQELLSRYYKREEAEDRIQTIVSARSAKRMILWEAAGELGLWDLLSNVEHDMPEVLDSVDQARRFAIELYEEGWFIPIRRQAHDQETKTLLSRSEFEAAIRDPDSFIAPPFGEPALWLEATPKWWHWKRTTN
jgi:hypothetical protein